MKTSKVTFHLRLDKLNSDTGEAPIYGRITIDGKRANFSINRWVNPERWKQTNKLQNARKQEGRELNFYIESIRSRIKEIDRELIDKKIKITAENIKKAFLGTGKKSKTVVEAFEYHNRRFNDLIISGEKSQGTLDRFEVCLMHLKAFMKFQYNKTDFYLDELEYSFITHFDYYFRTVRKCNNNSTVKYVRNFRKTIKLAVDEGWLDYDIFAKYKGKVTETDRDFLTPEEIEIVQNKEISNARLNLIKNVFLFSVYTGYSYADVKKLTYKHIIKHIDGELWIFTKRQKTHVNENVMLLYPALHLIDKYRSHPICQEKGVLFPIPSNQKVNAYLKELADICGINKNITFHMARHTFATSIMLANDVSMETTSDAMGHLYLKQTQHYGKMLNSKVSADFKKLNEKFKPKTDLNKGISEGTQYS